MTIPSFVGRQGRSAAAPILVPAGPILAAASLFLVAALPAQAHHFMELTQLQPTPLNGFLSGLAHPVLGPDHLLFLVALSLLGLRQRRRWLLGLLAVGLGGSALGLLLPGLPGAELILAGTLALEALVLLGWVPSGLVLPAMALHGYVLSAAVVGWTSMPIASYLVGLLCSQGVLLLAALALLRPMAERVCRAAAVRRWMALGLVGLSLALGLAAELG